MSDKWIEKYKPVNINDFVLKYDQKKIFYQYAKNKTICNLIICGINGIGKTAIVRYIAEKIYGKELMKQGMMELSASDSSEIKTMKKLFVDFSKTSIPGNIKFKIIFFDEADNMTKKMQETTINLLNDSSMKNIYYIFTCNNSSKISSSIQSKCQIIKLSISPPQAIKMKLEKICKLENIEYDKSALMMISTVAAGDIRLAINILQSVGIGKKKITQRLISEVKGMPSLLMMEKLLICCSEKKTEDALKRVSRMLNEGYCGYDIAFLAMNMLTNNIGKVKNI